MRHCIFAGRQGLRKKCRTDAPSVAHAHAVEEVIQFGIGKDALVEAVHGNADCGLAADTLIDDGLRLLAGS